MVDFFGKQEQSRRTTRWLLLLYAAAVVLIAAAVTLVTALGLLFFSDPASTMLGAPESWSSWAARHASLLMAIAAGTLAFIGLASLYRAAQLAQGGAQVARMLGATEVSGEDSDPLHQRLINVTEEMAIASGLPVPQAFVLEQEPGINAFAAGLTSSDAAIAVTRGALDRLDRAELQGVVAHELSHVLNGDMRINQQLMGLTFGILVLSLMGRWLLYSARYGRRGRSGGGGAIAALLVLGLALMVIGSIGVLFSRLIKAAVSRQREVLADASAVQFTRDPSGLAGALKKIGGYTSTLSAVDTEEISHMLFERGSRAFSGWLATHPPIEMRIRALDPSFGPERAGTRHARASAAAAGAAAGASATPVSAASVASAAALESAGAPAAELDTRHAATGTSSAAPSAVLLAQVGQVGSPAVGSALRASLPEELYHAAHSRESSLLLVLAMACAPGEAVRERQFALLENQLGRDRANRCRRLRAQLDELEPQLRLPLLELTLPALKQRPTAELRFLFDLLERLSPPADEQRLADYVLLRVLAAYLEDLPGPAAGPPRVRLDEALRTLLAAVAAYGHEDAASALAAYRAGIEALADAAPRGEPPAFEPLARARDLARLDAALARLAQLKPAAKRRVLAGLLATIHHDHKVEIEERELFRAIAATLGCPVPAGTLST